MYDKFVHADMKQKQRQLTTLLLDYMNGNVIFDELNEFTDRRGFHRNSGQRFSTIEIIYESHDSKGVTDISSVTWSEHNIDYPLNNGVRLNAEKLSDMVDYLIDHSYVAHTDTIYKQVIGMAMGVHNGPQMANLYCAHYELQYVLRRSIHYLTTLKLYITDPATPTDKLLRAEITLLFNMCRLMDDIAVVGMPDTIDTAAMLRDERETDGSNGVYPTYMTDTNGNVTLNPMEVNKEKHGLTCSYLDMFIQFKAHGHIQFEVYNKRDDMPVFQNYKRFPHIESTMAHTTLYKLHYVNYNHACHAIVP